MSAGGNQIGAKFWEAHTNVGKSLAGYGRHHILISRLRPLAQIDMFLGVCQDLFSLGLNSEELHVVLSLRCLSR